MLLTKALLLPDLQEVRRAPELTEKRRTQAVFPQSKSVE
jgi:hypothetical protein